VGYPMVVFETTIVSSSLNLNSEMKILTPLTRITIGLLGIYLALKIGDIYMRDTWKYLLDGTFQTNSFLAEIVLGAIVPWLMLLSGKIRRSRKGVFTASALIIGGVVLNRINVFLVGYTPSVTGARYFPAPGEIFITLGFIAALMFIYRFLITYLPVLSGPEEVSS